MCAGDLRDVNAGVELRAMSDNKTTATDASVADFLAAVEPEVRREDAYVLDAMFRRVTGEEPRMWGPTMIGYGSYHYKYDSGREGDWLRTGFSPRKAKHSIYLMGGYCDDGAGAETAKLMGKLGPHSHGKSCLYITRLARVDMGVLEEMVRVSWEAMGRLYPAH